MSTHEGRLQAVENDVKNIKTDLSNNTTNQSQYQYKGYC